MSLIILTGHLKLSHCRVIAGLCKKTSTKNKSISVTQVVGMAGKARREACRRYWRIYSDDKKKEMDELCDNKKIITVDGLPGVGKDKLARKLADEFGMLYMEVPPIFDFYHNTSFNFDCSEFSPKLPFDLQRCDPKMFHADPKGRHSIDIQLGYYFSRVSAYIDALYEQETGKQGVVIQRSPWSDTVFAKAMLINGYITPGDYKYYKRTLEYGLHQLVKPHIVVYLEISAKHSLENIKKRGLPHEKNSNALNLKFLEDVRNIYINDYIPEISKDARIVRCGYWDERYFDYIVQCIERFGLDREDFRKIDERKKISTPWIQKYFFTHVVQKKSLMQSMINPSVPEMMLMYWHKMSKFAVELIMKNWKKCRDFFNPKRDNGFLI